MTHVQVLKEEASGKVNIAFARDVQQGLSASPKQIPSKYFYDNRGDSLFQQIMQMDEYYLTNCEFEILDNNKGKLFDHFYANKKPFELVEFGAGDGLKTKLLIGHFLENNAKFQYIPIDISQNALDLLASDLDNKFSRLEYSCLCGDYFECLSSLNGQDKRKAVLFLGSNIGNFSDQEAVAFLRQVRKNLSKGDFMLTGFDMMKDPDVILRAYNDPQGITADFNLNLLDRINRELGADFNPRMFRHYPVYDPVKGEARSYLVSLRAHSVYIEAINQEFQFEAWEAIYTEISRKYNLKQIHHLAELSGFRMVDNYIDGKKYFVDSLWRAE